jgi:hypothetical protein
LSFFAGVMTNIMKPDLALWCLLVSLILLFSGLAIISMSGY